jgi:hypothetical protein
MMVHKKIPAGRDQPFNKFNHFYKTTIAIQVPDEAAENTPRHSGKESLQWSAMPKERNHFAGIK